MDFFNSAIDVLQTLVIALGGGLCVWGGINLLEGYGQDNPAAKSQGVKQLVAGGGPDFVAGHAFFLFFMDDDPALRFSELMASLSLHGQVSFMVGSEIHLLIGGNTVQAADTVFIFSHRGFLTFAIKARMNDIRLSKNGWSWFMDCSEYHCHPQYSAFFCPRPRCQLVFLV